ncbi:MAG: DUF2851 family protein [Ignavibacteriaceae bacterium]|nr:DUF2851 family protein [Ignavibacteriaceae bacterium]
MGKSNIKEKFLYEIWKKQDFLRTLRTKDGDIISVLDAGVENKDTGGPDFKNARIKIGHLTFCGDVEIDGTYSDWKNHGHNLNKHYNKVVLHAVLQSTPKQNHVYSSEGRKIQSISIEECISTSLRTAMHDAILKERNSRIFTMPCSELAKELDVNEKVEIITQLGIKRFKNKKKKILVRLKELKYLKEINLSEPVVKYDFDQTQLEKYSSPDDFKSKAIWQQLLIESVFEALGYSKNKEIMVKLARSVDIEFLSLYLDIDNFVQYVEAALFNISGLMPDIYNLPDEETSEYTRSLAKFWSEIKPSYSGITFSEEDWHFYGQRPINFPTIRIAGGSRLINRILKDNLIHRLLKSFEEVDNLIVLERIMKNYFRVEAEGYWTKHFVFDKPSDVDAKYFVGTSRADEIIVNIILPIAHLYFEIFGKEKAAANVIRLYTNYSLHGDNRLVKEISESLGLKKATHRAILYQGMIELFRGNCGYVEPCKTCPIGEKVFC